MQLVETSVQPGTEGAVMNAIFDACRANEQRLPYICGPHAVAFELRADGQHNAVLRVASGVVVAIAIVDKFDV